MSDVFIEGLDDAKARAVMALEIYEGRVPPSLPVIPRLTRDYQKASSAPRKCDWCSEYCPKGSADARRCLACDIPFDAER